MDLIWSQGPETLLLISGQISEPWYQCLLSFPGPVGKERKKNQEGIDDMGQGKERDGETGSPRTPAVEEERKGRSGREREMYIFFLYKTHCVKRPLDGFH